MLELIFLPFFQRALAVGLILGVLMAVLGVFAVLRRMSFFADALGHAALTGIAIGLLLHVNPFFSALLYSLLVALGIAYIKRQSNLPLDTLLGIFFSVSVALGVILIQLTPGYQTDLINFLFGNILTVTGLDTFLTAAFTVVTLLVALLTGKAFIAITFDRSLAQAEGIAVEKFDLIFLLILAGVIALAIKLVGVILVTAMLVTPAATAHNLARSLSSMFIISIAVSLVSVMVGMTASALLGTASGPTIILSSTVLFFLSLLFRPLLNINQ